MTGSVEGAGDSLVPGLDVAAVSMGEDVSGVSNEADYGHPDTIIRSPLPQRMREFYTRLRIQAIAKPVYRKQMLRFAGCDFDLLPQLHHELIERARGAVIFDAPHLGENGIA